MTAPPLDREELLRDSQATLREVAGILSELWDLREWGLPTVADRCLSSADGPREALVHSVLEETNREVHSLREGIGALQELFPEALQRDGFPGATGVGAAAESKAQRASEIIREVQTRLDRLADTFDSQGLGME